MFKALMLAGVLLCAPAVAVAHDGGPTDPQIAHVAYTAGQLDVTAAEQALDKSTNAAVRAFAEEMVRDHKAVNDAAIALVTRLEVTPEANPISTGLTEQAAATHARLALLEGAEFDRAYVANEVAFHQAVNNALDATLIPGAHNAELKSLLQTGLALFQEHQAHAEHLAMELQ